MKEALSGEPIPEWMPQPEAAASSVESEQDRAARRAARREARRQRV